MLKKVKAIYSIVISISVIGMWGMTILTGGIVEGLFEVSFHLASEFLMAILLLLGGIGLLRGKAYGKKLYILSNGMLIYSVLNAAGYFGERDNVASTVMFLLILLITSLLLLTEFGAAE